MIVYEKNKNSKDCSGMDALFHAMRDASDMLQRYEHVYSCDCEEFCQNWILNQHDPEFLFTNILARDWTEGGQSYDLISNEKQGFPSGLDVLVTGPLAPSYPVVLFFVVIAMRVYYYYQLLSHIFAEKVPTQKK